MCNICYLKSIFSAMEVGPQPHGVVRSNIYTAMKFGVQHMLDWVRSFNSGAMKHRLPTEIFSLCHTTLKCPKSCKHCISFNPFFASFKASFACSQVLFLMEDLWMCSPWSNTLTTQETVRVTTSQQPFILNSRYSLTHTVLVLCQI